MHHLLFAHELRNLGLKFDIFANLLQNQLIVKKNLL